MSWQELWTWYIAYGEAQGQEWDFERWEWVEKDGKS